MRTTENMLGIKKLFIMIGLFFICLGGYQLFDTYVINHLQEVKTLNEVANDRNWQGPYIITKQELEDNLYRIEAIKELENNTYSVYYIQVPDTSNMSIDELISFINSKSYDDMNSDDGVNCKWVTTCAVTWAIDNNVKYDIEYSSSHVRALLYYDNKVVDFNWGENTKVSTR